MIDEQVVEVPSPQISGDSEQIVDVAHEIQPMRDRRAKLIEDATVPLDKEKIAEVRQLLTKLSPFYSSLH